MTPRPQSSAAQRARSALGAAARHGDPEQIEQARQDLAEANLAARIREAVAGWPPLSAERRERLALLLRDTDAA
jgi:hypothetical protein